MIKDGRFGEMNGLIMEAPKFPWLERAVVYKCQKTSPDEPLFYFSRPMQHEQDSFQPPIDRFCYDGSVWRKRFLCKPSKK